ncbi:fructosamine kinase family protein [Thalassotalea hakodatensis]|uniref:fructosamine kinase family protein n=1 Tax=Thalassotalea hakodatensis TaxID=3030492 RepID=UPI002573549E|nr:fructosamine kinase family protein [Thalassotalea hakodatensis]
MWNSIAKSIEQALSSSFKIEKYSAVTGGDINESFLISGEQQRYFVKVNDKARLEHFDAEAYNLNKIRESECIACPSVITTGVTTDKAFLVLHVIDFHQPSNALWRRLGEQLATMHKQTSHGQFGWQQDNVIGSIIQPNRWSSNWRQFFAEQRIGWQLQLLNEKSIVFGDIDFITNACHQILLNHHVEPCLLHGDLWRGNIGFANEQPVIFDPASYYGDREADLAMTELFGALPEDFYHGYYDTYPLPEAYGVRKHVYNLYHVLNHANIFGGVYVEQAKACINRILSMA